MKKIKFILLNLRYLQVYLPLKCLLAPFTASGKEGTFLGHNSFHPNEDISVRPDDLLSSTDCVFSMNMKGI